MNILEKKKTQRYYQMIVLKGLLTNQIKILNNKIWIKQIALWQKHHQSLKVDNNFSPLLIQKI